MKKYPRTSIQDIAEKAPRARPFLTAVDAMVMEASVDEMLMRFRRDDRRRELVVAALLACMLCIVTMSFIA